MKCLLWELSAADSHLDFASVAKAAVRSMLTVSACFSSFALTSAAETAPSLSCTHVYVQYGITRYPGHDT